MEDELHPRSELYYRQQARPIPPIPDLGVADMEAFVVAAGFQLPGHLGRDYNAALRHDFNIAYRKIARQELTTPNSRTDSVALAKGALRLVKQGLSFRGQPEAENKFYRCEVGDQYTKESMKEWVEKCVAREMRQDKAHIQTSETAQQLVLCVMSVSALHALFPHVDRSFFRGRKKESERLEWVGEGEERKQVRKVVYGVEDVDSTITSSSTSASALPLPNCVSRENEGHGAGTLGKTLPRARLLRVFGTLPGNPQSPSSVMAWEVGFRHCSNENYEKRFGIKIDKKPHDPSSTQELVEKKPRKN
eukprot:g29433.t1